MKVNCDKLNPNTTTKSGTCNKPMKELKLNNQK